MINYLKKLLNDNINEAKLVLDEYYKNELNNQENNIDQYKKYLNGLKENKIFNLNTIKKIKDSFVSDYEYTYYNAVDNKKSFEKTVSLLETYIPKNYITSMENGENSEYIYSLLNSLHENRASWVTGECGTGKTYLIYCYIIYSCYMHGYKPFKVINEIDINYRSIYSNLSNNNVFLDDIGTKNFNEKNEYVLEFVYKYINDRLSNNKKIIITSNKSIESYYKEIKKVNCQLADKIMSRLSCFFNVKTDNVNYRIIGG